jgi:hypothetical protein
MRSGFLLSYVLSVLTASICAQEEGITWLDNYKQALEEAKRTSKPIFLEFRCEA